ncbi:hypothetical protein H8959_001405 [Pygathrix nigripes]
MGQGKVPPEASEGTRKLVTPLRRQMFKNILFLLKEHICWYSCRMSSTVSYWILNSTRNSIATLQGGRRLYSRYVSNRNKLKWRLFSRVPPTLNSSPCGGFTLIKAYRHTSTEEDDFHLQLSPEQINEVLRAG